MLLLLFMVCDIAHFGYNGATVCTLIHRQLSAPMRKPSSIHCCARPIPQRCCRISIAGTQISLHTLSLHSAYNTLHSAVHTFPVITQKITSNLASQNSYQLENARVDLM